MDQLVAMRVFVDVVDLGSLSAAANKLDMSRSMATRYMASLERTFGARLLHRSCRSLGLTVAGGDVLPYCRQILALADDINSVIASKNAEPSGLIRVTCSISFGQSYLAEALARFMDIYPRITVEMLLADRPVNLVEERIDLAVQVGDVLELNLVTRLLSTCISEVCASPEYLARKGVPLTPGDLSGHNCLIHTRQGGVWRFSREAAVSDGPSTEEVSVSGDFSANDTLVLLKAALAGRGVACLPAFSTAMHIRSGALVSLLPAYHLPELGIYALFASRKHVPVTTRSLLDFLVGDIKRWR